MNFKSKLVQCRDCGATFTFSAVEQEYFHSRGNAREPEQCPSCRQAQKERAGAASAEPDNPRRSEYHSYSATCARCGKTTEVPFEPHRGRPVYCSNCYNAVRSSR